MLFQWRLSDYKTPQVSRTPLRILVVLTNAVVWILSTRPPTSKSSRPFNYPLVIVPNAPITIGTIATFIFHSFFNNAVVWMVSTHPPTSKSSSPFSDPLVTVPNTKITIGIIVTCMFHSFFNSLARSRYLSFFSHSFSFILWSAGTAKPAILQVPFFSWLLLSLVFWPRLGEPWCNGYRLKKWTRRYEFKSLTRLIAFHIALIPLGKVWIQSFSLSYG